MFIQKDPSNISIAHQVSPISSMSVFWCVKPIECLTKYMPSILNKHQQNTCFHTVMPPVSVNKAGNSSPSVRLLAVAPYSFTIVSADFQLHAAAIKSPHYFSPHNQLRTLIISDLLQENIALVFGTVVNQSC